MDTKTAPKQWLPLGKTHSCLLPASNRKRKLGHSWRQPTESLRSDRIGRYHPPHCLFLLVDYPKSAPSVFRVTHGASCFGWKGGCSKLPYQLTDSLLVHHAAGRLRTDFAVQYRISDASQRPYLREALLRRKRKESPKQIPVVARVTSQRRRIVDPVHRAHNLEF